MWCRANIKFTNSFHLLWCVRARWVEDIVLYGFRSVNNIRYCLDTDWHRVKTFAKGGKWNFWRRKKEEEINKLQRWRRKSIVELTRFHAFIFTVTSLALFSASGASSVIHHRTPEYDRANWNFSSVKVSVSNQNNCKIENWNFFFVCNRTARPLDQPQSLARVMIIS